MAKAKKLAVGIAAGGVAALIIVGAAGCAVSKIFSSVNDKGMGVEVSPAEMTDLIRGINVSGTINGVNTVKVTSSAASKIESLLVSPGDYVKKGDVLCIFDSSSLQDEYDALKQEVENAEEMSKKTHTINVRNLNEAKTDRETSLAQAQRAIDEAIAARDKASSRYNAMVEKYNAAAARKDELYNQLQYADEESAESLGELYQEAVSEFQSAESEMTSLADQLDSCEIAIQSAKDAYDSAKRSADSAVQNMQDVIDAEKFNADNTSQKQLNKLAEQIEECTVKAPIDGMVTSLNAAEGSIPSSEAIMTIVDDSSLVITADIRESDILRINDGMKAVVKTSATGDEEFDGEVTKVVKIFQESSDDSYSQTGGSYTAEITVDGSRENLFIGMKASVQIILEEKENVLAVPYDSIVEKEDGKKIVYISRPQDDGTFVAEEAVVEAGMESDYLSEIVSSEVSEGDNIILNPNSVSDGLQYSFEYGGFDE